MSLKSRLLIAIIALILLFVMAPFSTVPAGNRGVITTFGRPSAEVYSEGIHFRWLELTAGISIRHK